MNDYWFRLRVLLSPPQALNGIEDSAAFRLDSSGRQVEVNAAPPCPIDQVSMITFSCRGFSSFHDAHEAGVAFERAVLVGSAAAKIGVDTGVDHTVESVDDPRRRAPGYRVLDETHGLNIFGGDSQPKSYASNIRIVQLTEVEEFFDSIRRAHTSHTALNEKQRLALELYGLSHFESSQRARFLILISCVESLSLRESRPAGTLRLLDCLAEMVSLSGLEADEKDSLNGVLQRARSESIGRACRKLVGVHLGEKALKRFQDLYDLRSAILHTGTCPVDADIDSATFDLDHIVSTLLRKVFAS